MRIYLIVLFTTHAINLRGSLQWGSLLTLPWPRRSTACESRPAKRRQHLKERRVKG